MQFSWSDLIDRARVYLDDDHDDTEGWIAPATWLTFANVEYAQLYKRWIRMGLIAPAWTDASFTGYTTTITNVLAVLGVAQDLGGNELRVLIPAQSSLGRAPFWGTDVNAGAANYWQATGSADSLVVTLEPRDSAGSYLARYLPTVAYATDANSAIDLPYGSDERLVLGIARRAKLKEGSASRQLDGLIVDADAELTFQAHSRIQPDTPRVRLVRPSFPRRLAFDMAPSAWRWA